MTNRVDLATYDPDCSGDGVDSQDHGELPPRPPSRQERSPTAELPTLNPVPGTCIDRYVVLQRLGATRHSEIFSAHDPELDRKVAMKLLSLDGVDEHDGYRRLMAEAQATARLAHPNVVKVHDLGTWRGRPYIAREFIEGASVHTWKKRSRPSRAEILRVMRLGGRGLAALHAGGLVHRDLNLHAFLVGDDGNVRVTDMDFVGSVESMAVPSALDGDSLDSLDVSGDSRSGAREFLTGDGLEETTGSFVRAAGLSGIFDDSPYASPEQLLGRVADARSDQFSFCVALYEALYDTMPFGSGTAVRRLARIERGRVRIPRCRYSRRTFNAIARGLSAEPEDRFPNVETLLKALAPRRQRYALLAPVLVGVATVAAVAVVGDEEAQPSYCASVGDKLDGVWDDGRRDELRAAFKRTGLSYAPDAVKFVESSLDTWTDEWTARHNALCNDQGDDADMASVAREMHCLSLRRSELSSVVDMLTVGDRRSIENAAKIVRGLRSVSSCEDPTQWLASRDQADDAEQLGRGLAKLGSLVASHRAKEALPLAEVLVDQARVLGHGPSLVRALGLRANALAIGRNPEAEAAMHEALSEALAQGAYPEVASVATALAGELSRRRKFEEAQHWLDHGEAALARGTNPQLPGYAGIESARGRIAALQGDFETALHRYQRARELRIESLGVDDDRSAIYRVNVGQAYQDLGRYDDARVEYEEAIKDVARALGPEHPNVGRTHMALGTVLSAQGEFEAALEHGKTAQRILTQAYGLTRAVVADAMVSTAMAYSRMGKVDASMSLQTQALEIYRATAGDRSFRVALALNNLGVEHYNTGKYADAEDYYRQGLERMVEVLGEDHVQTARMQNTLAGALLSQRKYEEAAELLGKVDATIDAKVTSDIPMVAYWMTGAAELDAITGDHDAAIEKLRRAERIHENSGGDDVELGQVRLMLASELRYVGREAEADAMVSATMATLQAKGTFGAVAITESGRFRERVREAVDGKRP